MHHDDEGGRTAAPVRELQDLTNDKSDRPMRKHRPQDLTPREREILQLVWSGLTNRHIARQLNISVKTVEAHRANMMKKLRVSNTAQLLKTAIEGGLLNMPADTH